MQVYTYDEAFQESVKYFDGDDLAAKVFVDKYALRNKENELLELTPTDMHKRIAKEFARIESKKFKKPLTEQQIFEYIDKFKYICLQGSPMYGVGNDYSFSTLSNCYVVPSPEDSIGSILKSDERLAQITKRRGGVGLDLSNLRPEGILVNNSARTTTGILSWMNRYSNTIREIGQSGRRGALMLTLDVHHPQILDFVKAKYDKTKVTGANISVRLTDEFLEAVKNNTDYEQKWPKTDSIVNKQINAQKVWDEIVQSARDTAEPGILFWDNIIKESPADCYESYKTVSTNPCSELPLSALDSCRLLCLNLTSYIVNPFKTTAYFDYIKLYEHAQIAQRLMDNMIDLEIEKIDDILKKIKSDPEDKEYKETELDLWKRIKSACVNGRRTGVGITGLGDTIAMLNLKYGSWKSIEIAETIYKTLKHGCYRSSVDMAKDLGAFPIWNHDKEKKCPFLRRIKDENFSIDNAEWTLGINGSDLWEDMQRYGRRNIALLTIAPTGSVSCLTQTTSGVEPVFMTKYTRRKKGNPGDNDFRIDFTDQSGDHWMEFDVYHHGLKKWMTQHPDKDIKESPYNDACAEEINWTNRVKLQAAIQKHCDHAISSTINLPEDVSVSEVKKIYEVAWESGLKGITIYRKNCRTGVLVEKKLIPKTNAPKRPKELECNIHHVSVQGKKYFVLVGLLEGEPFEIFAGKGGCINDKTKTGKIIKYKRPKYYKAVLDDDTEISPITIACDDNEEVITRLVSLSLRHGASLVYIQEQLLKVEGELYSFAKAIGRALKKYVPDGTKGKKCPECEDQLVFQSGCVQCMGCGYSVCS